MTQNQVQQEKFQNKLQKNQKTKKNLKIRENKLKYQLCLQKIFFNQDNVNLYECKEINDEYINSQNQVTSPVSLKSYKPIKNNIILKALKISYKDQSQELNKHSKKIASLNASVKNSLQASQTLQQDLHKIISLKSSQYNFETQDSNKNRILNQKNSQNSSEIGEKMQESQIQLTQSQEIFVQKFTNLPQKPAYLQPFDLSARDYQHEIQNLIQQQESNKQDDQICIDCNIDNNYCECGYQKYYDYYTSSCKSCPNWCTKCSYDIFGSHQVQCYQCDPSKINKFCNKCNDGICIECKGSNRILPDCGCQDNFVPKQNSPYNCIECEGSTFYNENINQQCTEIDKFNQIQSCQYDNLCTPINTINPYCIAVSQRQNNVICSQCTCNREPPNCLCYDKFVPVQGNDLCCKNCDDGTYYSLIHDNCKNQIANNIINYYCPENETCQDCKQINPYCKECDNNQCKICYGNRLPPFCMCQEKQAASKIDSDYNQCYFCKSDEFYKQGNDPCSQIQYKYDCYIQEVCKPCNTYYNQFCLQCNDQECLKCEGNRVPPYCKCQEDYVANDSDINICLYCDSNTFYDQNKDICRKEENIDNINDLETYTQKLVCLESQVCQSCTTINQYCLQCTKDIEEMTVSCNKCSGDLKPYKPVQTLFFDEQVQITECGCPQGYYSLSNSTDTCKPCVQNAVCHGMDIIDVQPGFWRLSNKTDKIYECTKNKENCLGGTANFTCAKGYSGALCEECDYSGKYWDIQYGESENTGCLTFTLIFVIDFDIG